MNSERENIRIVAIFGSAKDHTLDAAEDIGTAIVRRQEKEYIVLTGGTEAGCKHVKDRAIRGAKNHNGRWIGVSRGRKDEPTVGDKSIVIHPGIGHKRNYLEACLCDAAIALEDGEGTKSEIIYCLSLGKPVVLVGNSWSQELPLTESRSENVLDDRLEAQCKAYLEKPKFQEPSGNATLDRLCSVEQTISNLKRAPLIFEYFDSYKDISAIVKSAKALAENTTSFGEFPAWIEARSWRDRYCAWMGTVKH